MKIKGWFGAEEPYKFCFCLSCSLNIPVLHSEFYHCFYPKFVILFDRATRTKQPNGDVAVSERRHSTFLPFHQLGAHQARLYYLLSPMDSSCQG
jgi:hypothetical protein